MWVMSCPSLFWESDLRGEKVQPSFSPFVSFFGLSPRDAERGLRKIPIPHCFQFCNHKFNHQGIVRRGAGLNSWKQVYPRIEVPKGLAPDPAWHTNSEELGSHQPRLLVGRGRHYSATKHSHWDAIRKRSFGLVLVTDCGGFAVSPRRFHTPIRAAPHSRESPSIGSSLTFERHISQSCGADIHSVHSFLAGTRRLIRSAAAWSIHPSCMGIGASIASPLSTWDRPVYRVPFTQWENARL